MSTDTTDDFILSVQTASGSTDVTARRSKTLGLAVHRAIAYDHRKKKVKPLDRWTVTHILTGLSTLATHEYLDTPLGAFEVARALGELDVDWTKHDPILGATTVRDAVSAVVARVKSVELEQNKHPMRFVVEPKEDGKGYVVMDTKNGDIVDTRLHRGLARERADELNRSW